MEKTKDSIKGPARQELRKRPQWYLNELSVGCLSSLGYWIGDEVGGLYDYGDGCLTSISRHHLLRAPMITREQYMEWQEYICDAAEFNFPTPPPLMDARLSPHPARGIREVAQAETRPQ